MNYRSAINLNWYDINTVFFWTWMARCWICILNNHFWLEHLPVTLAEQRGATWMKFALTYTPVTEMEGTLDWYCLDFWQNHLGTDLVALKLRNRR